MTEITITTTAPLALSPDALEYADASKAENTRRAYASHWQQFVTWCSDHREQSLPAYPSTVANYITEIAGRLKVGTIERRLSAIAYAHKLQGHTPPTASPQVESVIAGIRRTHGTKQTGKKAATVDILRRLVATCENSTIGTRDRALLLVGFAGAFRRSELVALDVGDVETVEQGLKITIRRSKTDQEGAGRVLGIPYGTGDTCPVVALRAWLKSAGISEGALFRGVNRHGEVAAARLSGKGVARAVKRAAAAAGLDESVFAGHSLRAGLATSAAAAGVEERVIANQTGHKSMTVLRRYIRDGSLFRDNAAGKVGL